MAVKPVVRYMLVCEDWHTDPDQRHRVTIVGLLTNLVSVDDPPFPLLYRELCVFLALAAGRGTGSGKVVCVDADTGQGVFETRSRPVPFGPDPLEVIAVPFRIRDCRFPKAGAYSIQYWHDGELLEERLLRLREG